MNENDLPKYNKDELVDYKPDQFWLKVTKVDNGYTLESSDTIEVLEADWDEKKTYAKLMRKVIEFFGYQDENYGTENLNITWDKKGRKV